MIEFLLAVGLIGLAVVFVIEILQINNYRNEILLWSSVVDDFLTGFTEIKKVVNVNASSLKSIQNFTEKHDKILELTTTMIDLHSEILKLSPSVRATFESTIIADFPVGAIIDLDEHSDLEEVEG